MSWHYNDLAALTKISLSLPLSHTKLFSLLGYNGAHNIHLLIYY